MYVPPINDIVFTMRHVTGHAGLKDSGRSIDDGVADAILQAASDFATHEIEPVARTDSSAILQDGEVLLPHGWPELYQRWVASGWNGISAKKDYGGQNLPLAIKVAVFEIWNAASMAFSMCPMITMSALEAIQEHATDEIKALCLKKLVSGEWTATIALTEPQAGSDLNEIKTLATLEDDGSYRIVGQKIFISWGDHNCSENIIHMVLARLPGSPPGTRGLSLFLVPKYHLNADGSRGSRNFVYCRSLERKLGIHASPTCEIAFGKQSVGATGYLVGEPHRGISCMFTMMNNARATVASQGVGIAEAATQKAISFAEIRKQGLAAEKGTLTSSPIIEHPDVTRMLLTMRALTQGIRAITHLCAYAIDMAKLLPEDKHWAARAAILTPIAKAFSSDTAVEVSSLGIQVHGGSGYIEEIGAARFLRDIRVGPLYEGTNGIQAIDLVTRKLPISEGRAVRNLIDELDGHITECRIPEFELSKKYLVAAVENLRSSTDWILSELALGHHAMVLAGATSYLRLFGLALSGVYLCVGAKSLEDDTKRGQRIALARFFCENLLAETAVLQDRVCNGAPSIIHGRQFLTGSGA